MLAVKVGVFYGTPLAAIVLALVYFVVLGVRVRRGTIARRRAAVLYSGVLLLPLATLAIVWVTAELTGYFAAGPGTQAWDPGAAVETLIGLLPIALYVGAPIAVFAVLFWLLLAFSKSP
jgi:hypothetical protein